MNEADITVTETNPTSPQAPSVRFHSERVKATYCNIANAISSKEEVVLNFGVNTSWDRAASPPAPMDVDLEHRIVLSPHAAKRFYQLLGRLLSDHESRFGPLG